MNLVSDPESEHSPLNVNLTKAISKESPEEECLCEQLHINLWSFYMFSVFICLVYFSVKTNNHSSSWCPGLKPGSKVLFWNYLLFAFSVWNHLCEGGRRQLKQRLVLLQLTSLKPETWGTYRKLQVGKLKSQNWASLGVTGNLWGPFELHKNCCQDWHFGQQKPFNQKLKKEMRVSQAWN